MYNIDWLILKTINQEKSITKAAAKLYITQPAITRRLKNLEDEFHCTILIRNPNGITFTPQGIELLAYANKALKDFRHLTESLELMGNTPRGSLSIGVSRVFANHELPAILKTFTQKYPQVKINLRTDLSKNIYKLLQQDEITLAVIRGEYNWNGETVLLQDEPICLVADKQLSMEDLPKMPFIVAESSIHSLTEEWWCENFTQAPNITSYVDSIDTCREMVINGLGWSIMPHMGLPDNKQLFIKPLYLKDGTPLHRPTCILYRHPCGELPSLRVFVEHMKSFFKK